MNRIDQLFSQNPRELISLYFCAGYPTRNGTVDVLKAMQAHGIDMVEIGIPFSDPMADGEVIQSAANKALENGMSLSLLFEQLTDVRKEITIPLLLMGYLNPVMQYGFDAFFERCHACGIDGIILPDLPFHDYLTTLKPIADRYHIPIIMLITPETSEERIRLIDAHTSGFIYMVSSAAITGAQHDFDKAKEAYFSRIEAMQLQNSRMIGFGISNKQTLNLVHRYATGAIIGSKFVQLQGETNTPDEAVKKLLESLKV